MIIGQVETPSFLMAPCRARPRSTLNPSQSHSHTTLAACITQLDEWWKTWVHIDRCMGTLQLHKMHLTDKACATKTFNSGATSNYNWLVQYIAITRTTLTQNIGWDYLKSKIWTLTHSLSLFHYYLSLFNLLKLKEKITHKEKELTHGPFFYKNAYLTVPHAYESVQ